MIWGSPERREVMMIPVNGTPTVVSAIPDTTGAAHEADLQTACVVE